MVGSIYIHSFLNDEMDCKWGDDDNDVYYYLLMKIRSGHMTFISLDGKK